ncbi:MAG: tryptophan synthase subunit beta [candidate division FCPU426 bacterium]
MKKNTSKKRKSPRLELPDALGHFGRFGGCYAPETLMPAVTELRDAYLKARKDPAFQKELKQELEEFAGRPTPVTFLKNLSEKLGGAQIFLKREDLLHTGAHKINNALGQILLARRMKKKRIIAETGAGQHGVAVATVCARFGMPAVIYMGEEDTRRQSVNVFRMKLLGAQVVPVTAGTRTLKDAINEAVRDWISNVDGTYYLLGSATGFHPYPLLVRDFQKVISLEARAQFKKATGALPDAVLACVNGGSNAMGAFYHFIDDPKVRLIGVEAAGDGVKTPRTAATMTLGKPGVFHGAYSYVLQTPDGQIQETHSISAGLDYPGVGPEHAYLKDAGRAEYVPITDAEAVEAFQMLCRSEGILPALESSHALAHAIKIAPRMKKSQRLLVCLSGRGDKDMANVENFLSKKRKAA